MNFAYENHDLPAFGVKKSPILSSLSLSSVTITGRSELFLPISRSSSDVELSSANKTNPGRNRRPTV